MNALILAVALFFASMGVVALVRPARVLGYFGVRELGADGRNEVRAVYGGFGLAVALTLAAALELPALRPGVLATVALAVFGMAAGRVVSWALDGRGGGYPALFFGVEIALGAALVTAYVLDPR